MNRSDVPVGAMGGKFARRVLQTGVMILVLLVGQAIAAATAPPRAATPLTQAHQSARANLPQDSPPIILAQTCPPQLRERGLCGPTYRARNPYPNTRPGRARTHGDNHLICINGARVGSHCVCPAGSKPRRVGARTYRCTHVARPCPRGMKRVGRVCVPTTRPPRPGEVIVCINGKRAGTRCLCPHGAQALRIGRNRYRCTFRPVRCPAGTIRKGRRCITIEDTHPTPPASGPHCRKGWIVRDGRCHPIVNTACPAGTSRKNGRCMSPPPPPASTSGPSVPTRAGAATNDDGPYEPDEVLVEITGPSPQQTATRLINAFGLATLSQTRLDVLGTSLYRFRIPSNRTVEDVVATLAREPGVATSQPNWRYALDDGARDNGTRDDGAAAPAPIDTARPAPDPARAPSPAPAHTTLPQYALDLIEARKANAITRGTGVLIALIDTGIEEDHPEIAGSIAGRFNTFPSQGIIADTHATAIASIITARQELAGIAPGARILAVQAFTPTAEQKSGTADPSTNAAQHDDGGRGTSHRIAMGLNWSLLKGARIINMSFSGPPLDTLAGKLIAKGSEAGVIFIAAAGNGGPSAPPAYPAADPAVIAVTAIDDHKRLYTHANIGPYIALAAPGVDVMAAAKGRAYDLASGTSFAAAHVSAVSALLLGHASGLRRDQVVTRLKDTALDLGPPGVDEQFGAGCINALRALLGLSSATSLGQQ